MNKGNATVNVKWRFFNIPERSKLYLLKLVSFTKPLQHYLQVQTLLQFFLHWANTGQFKKWHKAARNFTQISSLQVFSNQQPEIVGSDGN